MEILELKKVEEENLKLQQLVFQQKREKLTMKKKMNELENKNKQLAVQLEQYQQENQEQEINIKQLKDHLAKSETIITKLQSMIKKSLREDNTHLDQSVPKTDVKSNKYTNQSEYKSLLKKKEEQYYQEEKEKVDLNQLIVQAYKNSLKKSSKDQTQSNKLPPINSDDKPITVQVLKSQLKKVNPQDLLNYRNDNENEQYNF